MTFCLQNSEAEELEQEKIDAGAMDDDNDHSQSRARMEQDLYSWEDFLGRVQASEQELREAMESLNAAEVRRNSPIPTV
jgi:hypothetical protein